MVSPMKYVYNYTNYCVRLYMSVQKSLPMALYVMFPFLIDLA